MIELKNIYKEYRNGNVVTPVLKEINLNINDGEFVAIVGASGSGKTTLLNIIGLIDNNTVRESVELPLLNRKIDRSEINSRVKEALKSVGLADYDKRKIKQLSGGQKQRVAIARAIVCGARVLLCDEPTGSLDSVSSGEIIKIIKELNNNGTTVILITHDNNIAQEAKRIIEIKDGRIVKDEKNC